jgi:hypothetical protein
MREATKAENFEQGFERVPAAGLRIGKTSDAIYRMIQRGELAGIQKGGKWFVARASIEKYLARMQEEATAGTAA